ncbi:MAG: beta-N-acetylglucosaminidase domain-containing protein [Ectothiorhodospiraceae bacterium]
MTPELGVIEGYYGPPWSWADRRGVTALLADHGYGCYHYAPKVDPHVREQWATPWPVDQREAMEAFAAHCRRCGVRFGIGLSPAGLQSATDSAGIEALLHRVAEIDAIGADDLVLLFDDLAGDDPAHLAARQIDLVHRAATTTRAGRVFLCPTWYSDDPLLDELFGTRPADYLEQLGRGLDPAIHVYWAGPEICPRAITPGDLHAVAERLERRPWLWDNYPVNDSANMREHLHLRGVTGRNATLATAVAGHAINPALQPWLTCLPALTLPRVYQDADSYRYTRAQTEAARSVLGPELGDCVYADLPLLTDRGRDRLSDAERARLEDRYAAFSHPAAREIRDWLAGGPGDACAPTGA